ncbi:MAG: uracil-DNA glycosylase [Flavobacteriales bacterium]|nr:uracil-DNA glycosylase [Flavobacteriales bacterium]
MELEIEQGWKNQLNEQFESSNFKELIGFVKSAYKSQTVYPPSNLVFEAFNRCTFENTKVVIIGQDPYHGPGQANGLCFSVGETVAFPPSLKNIFKELESDVNAAIPSSGNLNRWADQGVLLLNAILTVEARQAGSHQNVGWEEFTDSAIDALNNQKENLVFLLWGGYAKKKGKHINRQKHLVLESGHPSPLSANRGYWFGNKHFSQCNAYLKSRGLPQIEW